MWIATRASVSIGCNRSARTMRVDRVPIPLSRRVTRLGARAGLIGPAFRAYERAVSLRPEAVRSWVVGGAPLDPDYEWHPAARAFQTPGMGERVMESMTPAALQQALVAAGVPDADAAEAGRHVDPTMKRCILALYRSAVHVGTEWTDDLRRVTAPGLVLWGERDPYAAPRFGARLAERTGARFVSLPGCSHWWQLERPDDVADELRRFW